MNKKDNLKVDFVPNNEVSDSSYEFLDESNLSLFQNEIASEPVKIDNLPIDLILCESEVTKTFAVQNDGTLIEIEDEVDSSSLLPEKLLTRKRRRDPKNWKCNVAKVNRQSGKSYTNRKGKIQRERTLKEAGCANRDQCPFKCMEKIDVDGRQVIHDSYWLLNDSEKRHFYASNVKRVPCDRKRTEADVSRKSYTLNYYFNYMKVDVRVCQQFFINTLDVNKGRVYYFFSQGENRLTVTPDTLKHGKHAKKKLSEEQKQGVRDHINKFPAIESHYCRQGSKKKYLEQGLNVARMYRLYATETDKPVKISAYREIFDFEFNLSFFRPKKDRCDKCIESEKLQNPTEEQSKYYSSHIERKEKAHAERNKDRQLVATAIELMKIGVILFDLENVFQLPIANANHLFYLRKFAVYVLTLFYNKTVYNVMWNEFCCGREGTHLASALIKGLKQIIVDNPHLEHLILWSDSCVPQNKNSYLSAALQEFLKSNSSGNVIKIDHKYSEAGHGEIQEVDNVHSVIENNIRHKFIYSPVSLVKEFNKIYSGKLKFKLFQMDDDDYFDYQALALASKYSVIPYTKVVQLNYEKNKTEISFKLDYTQTMLPTDILLKQGHATPPILNQLQVHSNISNLKIANLKSMFGIMPEIDKLYYETEFEILMKKRQSAETNDIQVEVATTSAAAVHEVYSKSKAKASPKSKTPIIKVRQSKAPKSKVTKCNARKSKDPQHGEKVQNVARNSDVKRKNSPACSKNVRKSAKQVDEKDPKLSPSFKKSVKVPVDSIETTNVQSAEVIHKKCKKITIKATPKSSSQQRSKKTKNIPRYDDISIGPSCSKNVRKSTKQIKKVVNGDEGGTKSIPNISKDERKKLKPTKKGAKSTI